MSQSQIEATELLCRLLEQDRPEVNAHSLTTDHSHAASHLKRERLLVLGSTLEWVTCPNCGVELARVVREISPQNLLLHCPSCEDVTGARTLRETYKVNVSRVVNALLTGLNFSNTTLKIIANDVAWRLGTTEPTRGQPMTWYFARQLFRPQNAARLREHIQAERSIGSCVILTSSELPLPPGSPLSEFDVRHLASVARIGQNQFEFFHERQGSIGSQVLIEAQPVQSNATTLRHVRAYGKVFIDGMEFILEPRQKSMLLALMQTRDHEMDKEALKTACGSQAQQFSPSKVFDRNPLVYQTFVRYLPSDERYALTIPEGDHGWLT